MPQQDKPQNNSKMIIIKVSKALSYFVYFYAIAACIILGIAFILLLFGANTTTPFVKFIYETGSAFLEPFRGIFPVRPVSQTGYFSPSILFAIMMYGVLTLIMSAVVNYVTLKMLQHQKSIDKEIS